MCVYVYVYVLMLVLQNDVSAETRTFLVLLSSTTAFEKCLFYLTETRSLSKIRFTCLFINEIFVKTSNRIRKILISRFISRVITRRLIEKKEIQKVNTNQRYRTLAITISLSSCREISLFEENDSGTYAYNICRAWVAR